MMAKALIDASADLNLQNEWGNSALQDASSKNHREMAKILLKAGIDSELKNNKNKSALDVATTLEMREVFLRHNTLLELNNRALTKYHQTRAIPSAAVATTDRDQEK